MKIFKKDIINKKAFSFVELVVVLAVLVLLGVV
jgi:prepilin-type N-terminal cleavage/methylation domain-containing protein